MTDEAKKPFFSRCSVGNGKWYWIAKPTMFSDTSDDGYQEPTHTGYASSPDEAIEAAERETGWRFEPNRGYGDRHDASWASHHRTRISARKRMAKTSNGTTTAAIEYIYECSRQTHDMGGMPDYDSVERYVVVKKTKTRLYVDRDSKYSERRAKSQFGRHADRPTTEQDYILRTFTLDRQEYERCGKVRRTSGHWTDHGTFYATPEIYYAERDTTHVPACLTALGLTSSADVELIKKAFRLLSKTHHPDAGGDAEAFVQLRKFYEEALLFAKSRAAILQPA